MSTRMIVIRTPGTPRWPEVARAQVEAIARDTVAELQSWLPDLPPAITLSCTLGTRVIPGLGFGASALDAQTIGLVVQPGPADTIADTIADTLAKHLRHALFHESHHLVRGWVRYGGAQRYPRVIDGVICEGLASAFERDAAGYAAPWCDYPAEAEVRVWVDELRALPRWAKRRHWMFQHPDGRRWIGYRAGTWIADRAMQASGRDAAQLVATPSAQILALAGLPPPRRQGLWRWLSPRSN